MNDGVAPAARISRSASASSSAVVMPGPTASATARSVRATTSPASRIIVSCSGVLISIAGPLWRRILAAVNGRTGEARPSPGW